jgi:AcrR family transcriptional regulator
VETPVVKPRQRADARRNRARLLDVAEDVFATRGVGASTEDIAAAAGVGIGTLFRHFPTKEALLEAVFVERLRRLAAEAEHLASLDGVHAGDAFFTFFRHVLDQARGKTALADALASAGIDLEHTAADLKPYLHSALEHLLTRAQQAGAVRGDISIAELLALLLGASRAIEHVGSDRAVAERTIGVILDGLRR